MSCGEVRERLPLFLGGDLDAEILAALEVHLEGCEDCAHRAAEATRARRALVAAFRARESELPRPELWPGIRAQLRAEGLVLGRGEERLVAPPALEVAPRRTASRHWTRALAPVAAAAVLMAVVELSGVFSSPAPLRPSPRPLPEARTEVVATPVVAPQGGLQRVDPIEASRFPLQYRRLLRGAQPAPGEVSSAAYLPPGFK